MPTNQRIKSHDGSTASSSEPAEDVLRKCRKRTWFVTGTCEAMTLGKVHMHVGIHSVLAAPLQVCNFFRFNRF